MYATRKTEAVLAYQRALRVYHILQINVKIKSYRNAFLASWFTSLNNFLRSSKFSLTASHVLYASMPRFSVSLNFLRKCYNASCLEHRSTVDVKINANKLTMVKPNSASDLHICYNCNYSSLSLFANSFILKCRRKHSFVISECLLWVFQSI